LANILKLAILPGPSPPSDFDPLIGHVSSIIDDINNSGGIQVDIENINTYVNVAIALCCSVFDLPGMNKFSKLPSGLKEHGCFKCEVKGRSVSRRVVYPVNDVGRERDINSILDAVQMNSRSTASDFYTKGFSAKELPKLMQISRLLSIHIDAMHFILNIMKKLHELLVGKRMTHFIKANTTAKKKKEDQKKKKISCSQYQ
jgi:hypothetical protein